MGAFKKLTIIAIFCGVLIGAFYWYDSRLTIDVSRQLLLGILLVPIVFIFNKYLEFNDYLRLLTKEIRDNLDLIEKMPYWLQQVRDGNRAWLPGIATNTPIPGYSLRYLSLNIYDNLINQKYWIYINRGNRGRLAELYHFFRQYCDIVQQLQTYPDIIRDPLTEMPHHAELFYSEITYNTNLAPTIEKIRQHSACFNLNDYQSFKEDDWWCPNWLKE